MRLCVFWSSLLFGSAVPRARLQMLGFSSSSIWSAVPLSALRFLIFVFKCWVRLLLLRIRLSFPAGFVRVPVFPRLAPNVLMFLIVLVPGCAFLVEYKSFLLSMFRAAWSFGFVFFYYLRCTRGFSKLRFLVVICFLLVLIPMCWGVSSFPA